MAIELSGTSRHILGGRYPEQLAAGVSIIRHGKKISPSGPLSGDGWILARELGEALGASAATLGIDSIQVQSGDVSRTIQTAHAVGQGAEDGYVRSLHRVPEEPIVSFSPPRRELSLSAISDRGSVFVQDYLSRMHAVGDVIEGFPRIFRPTLRRGKERIEQAAAGKLLLEWLKLDDKRMTLPNGEPDLHTRSAREIARKHAFYLRQELQEVLENYSKGKQVGILKCSHENMVLIWARYFLYQQLKGKRRGQPDRIINGMQIVERIGGKIPYLGGVHMHLFKKENGDLYFRARFNNAWYEVDMDMINKLADEEEATLGNTMAAA